MWWLRLEEAAQTSTWNGATNERVTNTSSRNGWKFHSQCHRVRQSLRSEETPRTHITCHFLYLIILCVSMYISIFIEIKSNLCLWLSVSEIYYSYPSRRRLTYPLHSLALKKNWEEGYVSCWFPAAFRLGVAELFLHFIGLDSAVQFSHQGGNFVNIVSRHSWWRYDGWSDRIGKVYPTCVILARCLPRYAHIPDFRFGMVTSGPSQLCLLFFLPPSQEGEDIAKSWGCQYFETSAKHNTGISELKEFILSSRIGGECFFTPYHDKELLQFSAAMSILSVDAVSTFRRDRYDSRAIDLAFEVEQHPRLSRPRKKCC